MTSITDNSSTKTKIKTRVLIISDTHSVFPQSRKGETDRDEVPFRKPLPKADVLLHCGDLTMQGELSECEITLSMLASIDAGLKLVISGNHDLTLDETYWARKGQQMHGLLSPDLGLSARAKEFWTGQRARDVGVTYLEEGTYSFVLANGAKLRVYASPYQPEFCDMAFPYSRNQDRFNPKGQCTPGAESIAVNPVPDFPAVDIMMTHGPPKGIRDMTDTGVLAGCEHLLKAAYRCKPKVHCFGHIHEGWGATRVRWLSGRRPEKVNLAVNLEKARKNKAAVVDISENGLGFEFGKDTLMVNASIMTVRYQPHNAPWIVYLDLEKNVEETQNIENKLVGLNLGETKNEKDEDWELV